MTPEEIKNIRKGAGLSQEAFGHEIGVSLNTIWRWEHGQGKPTRLGIMALERFKKEQQFKENLV